MEITVTLSIDTAAYVRSHGRQPKGTGAWGFEVVRYVQYADRAVNETSVVFAPDGRTLVEAKRWVRHNLAGQRDIVGVSVAP